MVCTYVCTLHELGLGGFRGRFMEALASGMAGGRRRLDPKPFILNPEA